MQAYSVTIFPLGYSLDMTTGRPAKTKRTEFGERLLAARQQLGLSQTQMAEKLGITQPSYAGWERRETALKPEHLVQLSAILNVTVDHLLGKENGSKRGSGPAGKARQIFERVSQLPRATQQRILANVEDALTAYEVRKGNA
jgi:transcriptional regulator with XRE-family HTH domain